MTNLTDETKTDDEDLADAPPPQRHSAPCGSLADIPDYRWDKRPDYDWGSHHERAPVPLKSNNNNKRNNLTRAQSVGSSDFRRSTSGAGDFKPTVPKRRQSSDDIDVDYKDNNDDDHSDSSSGSGGEFGGDKEEKDASESSGSCYSDASDDEGSIDLKGSSKKDNDDDSGSSSSSDEEADLHDSFMNDHEEDAEEVGYNWRTRRRIMRCKSDLTLYESKDDDNNKRNSRGGKRPRKILVKFNETKNTIQELPPLTEEDKAAMFYTKREIREMRDDRERERAEREYEKRNRTYADNSSKIGSIFSSAGGPKKAPPAKKRNSAVERLHGEKQAKELEKEKKMQEMLDSLQLAMAQAKMVTGY